MFVLLTRTRPNFPSKSRVHFHCYIRLEQLFALKCGISTAYCSLRNEMERNEMEQNEMERNEMKICSLRNENL